MKNFIAVLAFVFLLSGCNDAPTSYDFKRKPPEEIHRGTVRSVFFADSLTQDITFEDENTHQLIQIETREFQPVWKDMRAEMKVSYAYEGTWHTWTKKYSWTRIYQ